MNHLKLLLAIFALLCSAEAQSPCSFPSYLRARPRWESQISIERSVIGAFWQFKTQSLETVDLTKPDETATIYTCQRQDAPDRFVLKFDSVDNHRTEFTCLKFIQRSPYVVQVMRSKATSTADDPNLCAESSLILDSSPLVWPQPEEFIPTADVMVGGFQFTITDHATGFDLCQTATLLPVWEADCMSGDGISVDFRQFQCRGDLGMELVQKLYNLGSWDQGGHRYTLVTDLYELWPRLWLLRAPAKPENPNMYDIDLFTSISITDTDDSSKPDSSAHYTLHLKRSSFTSVCDDESLDCTRCEINSQNVNCLKTCQSEECLKLANQPPCNFNSNDQGEWLDVSINGTRSVNISAQSLSIQDQQKRSCLDLKTELWFENVDRRTVMSIFDNGCRPRYQCTEFHRRSESVLQFQMSDVAVWPQALPLNPGQLCAKEKFDSIKQSDVQKDLHPFRWRALVNMNPQAVLSSSVSCGLTGRFYLIVYTSNGEMCLGNIDTCQGNSTMFDFNQGSQCSDSVATSHSCIASFTNEENGDKILITRSIKTISTTVTPTQENPAADYLCWVFHQGAWDPAPRLYLTHASDCHTEIGNDIAYRNFTGYLAQFDIAGGSGSMGSYECSSNTENPFGSITTKKQPTSSTPSKSPPAVGGLSDESSKITASLMLIPLGYLISRNAGRFFGA